MNRKKSNRLSRKSSGTQPQRQSQKSAGGKTSKKRQIQSARQTKKSRQQATNSRRKSAQQPRRQAQSDIEPRIFRRNSSSTGGNKTATVGAASRQGSTTKSRTGQQAQKKPQPLKKTQKGSTAKSSEGDKTAQQRKTQTVRSQSAVSRVRGNRQLMLVRSTECMERAFPNWIQNTYSAEHQQFQLTNMNQYIQLPVRDGVNDYVSDPPLTMFGRISAQIITRSLLINGMRTRRIYTSPAFRCIETANSIVESYRVSVESSAPVKICIEPGLLEPIVWYRTIDSQTKENKLQLPNFFTAEQLLTCGYPIDTTYKPSIELSGAALASERTEEDAYRRLGNCIKEIVSKVDDGERYTVMFICHALGIDAGIRFLNGRHDTAGITYADYFRMGEHYPPGCAIALTNMAGSSSWEPNVDPPYPMTALGACTQIDIGFTGREEITTTAR